MNGAGRLGAGLLRLLALLGLVGVALPGAALVGAAAAVPPVPAAALTAAGAGDGPSGSSPPGVELAGQSAEVAADGLFTLRLRTTGVGDPAGYEVAVTVHSAVTSRSAFALTLEDRRLGDVIDFVPPTPLTTLPAVGDERVVALPLAEVGLPRRADGVYPVRVQLRDAATRRVVDGFTTHLVVPPAPDEGLYPLAVAWAQPVHAPPALQPDGRRFLSPADLERLAVITGAVAAHPDVELTLVPTPETVDALARSDGDAGREAGGDAAARSVLADLLRAQDGRQLVGGPYVHIDLAQLRQAGLDGAVETQVGEGNRVLEAVLGAQPHTETWLAGDTLDEEGVERLRELGITQLVLPEDALAPIDRTLTLARPFVVDGGDGRPVRAAVADAGLARHLVGGEEGDEVLRAHQLLADLAVLFYDSPGIERGVVVRPPDRWAPYPAFLATVLDALGASTVLDPVTVEGLLRRVPPDTSDGERLVRRLQGPDPVRLGITPADLAEARTHLRGFRAMVVGPPAEAPGPAPLEQRLLVAQAEGLSPPRRQAYLDGVATAVEQELAQIQAPDGQHITLTAREGTIPLTIHNDAGYPVEVRVRLGSDKLEFPEGDSRLVLLDRPNTKIEVPVRARTSGAFRLSVSLVSPDGSLPVRDARLTVRSTAASWVGLSLTAGAGLFLVVWWVRNWRTARRDPHLLGA